MRKLNRNLPYLKKKKKRNKTNLFSNETVRKFMKNTIEKKNRNSKMVDISLIYRQTLGQCVDLWYLLVLEQQMFLIHGDYSFNC